MNKSIKICIYFVIFILLFVFLNRLVSPKYATDLIEGSMISSYYNSNFDNDVIFIGDCEVYANFSPMVMYEENGIKSYVRGSSQQLIWQSYYLLKETFTYEIPKVVVFNVDSLRYDRVYSGKVNEAYNRLMIDYMKWSKEKVDLINISKTNDESFLSYVFPILRYHSRIDELTSEDFDYLFKYKDNTFNGFLVNKNVKPLDELPYKNNNVDTSFREENIYYLDKMVELCKENNVELILIKAPSVYPYWYEEYDNYLYEYAQKNNINYYNLIKNVNEIGIDYDTDTYDGGLHLNLYGATKLSKYFSNILVNNYDIPQYDNDEYFDLKLYEYKKYIGEA